MRVEYDLDAQDYAEVQWVTIRTNPLYGKRVLVYRALVMVLLLALWLVLSRYMTGPLFWVSFFATLLLCVVWFVLAPKRMQAAVRSGAQKQVQQGKTGFFFARRTVVLQQDGIRVLALSTAVAQDSLFGYGSVTRMYKDERRLYVVLADAVMIVVPARAFAGAEQRAAFEAELQQRTGHILEYLNAAN